MMQSEVKMNIPKNVSFIISKLEENGFLAYIVGGCVRDSIMGKTPDDWDITTNAKPHDILSVFKDFKTIKTGIKHGTVGIILDHIMYEVTTFRIDGKYTDSRHPEAVSFVDNLYEDLKRRDFTVNAICYNEKTGISDFFNGADDIENKIIRCVGNPDIRFLEDALRIMRALRFSAQLGFKIEDNTKKAIFKNKHLLENISVERVQIEFTKTLLSDNSSIIYEYRDVFKPFLNGLSCDENLGGVLSKAPKILYLRLSLLLYNLLSDKNENMSFFAKDILKNLRFNNHTINKVFKILDNINMELLPQKSLIRKHIRNLGYEAFQDIIKTREILSYNNSKKHQAIISVRAVFEEIKEKKLCSTLFELAINGNDLIDVGFKKGKETGIILDKLLTLVINDKLENKKEILLKKAKKLKSKTEE